VLLPSSVAAIWLADTVLYGEAPWTNASVAIDIALATPAIISVVIVVVPLAIPMPPIRVGTTIIAAAIPLRRGDVGSS
jgi:hypothetical protein